MNFSSKHDAKERILSRIEVDAQTGCWNYTAYVQDNGYAKMTYNRKTMFVHRMSYMVFKGDIPAKHDVCHTCDNRKCVNPDHLFIGTRKENMQDAVAKGRQAKGEKLSVLRRGEKSYMAKLKWADVFEIRASPEAIKHLAARYNVSTDNIRRIKRHDTWREF